MAETSENQRHPGLRTRQGWPCALAAVVLIAGQADRTSAQCNYGVTAVLEAPVNCGIVGPANTFATAINDNGVVAGYYDCLSNPRPFIWSEEMGFVLIPLPPGVSDARPADINNNNEIVGSMNQFSDGPHAFHWKDGIWTELAPIAGLPKARANSINDNSEIVGESANILIGPQLACIWHDGVVEQIEPLANVDSVAHDVNEQASVVGRTSRQLDGTQRGFWWNDGTAIEIPPLARATTSEAIAVNDHDVVIGRSTIPIEDGPNQLRSWVYQDEQQIDLGTLDALTRYFAEDVNNAMQVVGTATSPPPDNSSVPFLWQHDVMHDVRSLLIRAPSNLNVRAAVGVNEQGLIVGGALIGQQLVAVVLAPIDRPLGDVNFDCTVDELDLIAVLEDWGPDRHGHATDMVSSITFAPPSDGRVDAADLAVVLGNWSTQPQSHLRH